MKDGKAVYMSFDIEVAGEAAGIILISAEIFRIRIVVGGGVIKIGTLSCKSMFYNIVSGR